MESLERRQLLACTVHNVNYLGDPEQINFNDSVVSLREAILAAADSTACDTIYLVPGTYELTSTKAERQGGDLDIFWRGDGYSPFVEIRTRNDNDDPRDTVIAAGWTNGGDRLIEVLDGANLTIRNVTLTGGDTLGAGGAIHSYGTLTVVNSIFHDNTAQGGGAIAIETGTTDTDVNDTKVTATIENSYFHANTSTAHGGAIFHEHGKLVLQNTTLANNKAAQRGGGLAVNSGSVRMINSTISSNEAGRGGGGLFVAESNARRATVCEESVQSCTSTIASSTIYANSAIGTTAGGGVDAQSPALVKIENTIVAGNSAWHERFSNVLLTEGLNLEGNTQSQGGNLFGDVTGAVHPQVRSGATVFDYTFRNPRLGTLKDNGGIGYTHAPLKGSPAIGHAMTEHSPPTTDQTGAQRDSQPDIGAVEFEGEQEPDPDPLLGDTNDDDVVDIVDLNNVRNNFGAQGGDPLGNNNEDGVVDIVDLNNVRNNFGATRTPARSQPVEVINVKDWSQCRADAKFCASPKSGDDDTFAIQAALNEARVMGEAHVRVPAGEYEVEELLLQGYALGLTGEGTLLLKGGSNSYAALTVDSSDDPPGKLPDLAFDETLVMPEGFTPINWVDGITIDGNRQQPHTGKALGLLVKGQNLLISNLTVQNTWYDPASATDDDAPAGMNVLVRGGNNVLSTVNSLNAGHTAFRNVGGDNWYYDIAAHDFHCRGFRAQLPNSSEDGFELLVGGPIYIIGANDQDQLDFTTTSNGAGCGRDDSVASLLFDPVPVGDPDSEKRISKVELRNLDVGGPNEIDPDIGEGNLLKFAAVEQMIVDGSTFVHTSPRLHSIRVAEGTIETLPTGEKREAGRISITNSWLSRNLFFEDKVGEPRYKSMELDHVTIGENYGDADPRDRKHSIENVRVWDFFRANEVRLHNFSESGISWLLPSAMEVTNSEFRGRGDEYVFGLILDPAFPLGFLQCSRFTWSNNQVSNSPENWALPFQPPPLFPCRVTVSCPEPEPSSAPAAVASDLVYERWGAAELLLARFAADYGDPPSFARRVTFKKR